MTDVSPIASLQAHATAISAGAAIPQTSAPNFGDLLTTGLHHVEERVNTANDLVHAFALSDSTPVHQVTIALEQARLSVELALQVRNRVVDAFHEVMNMQL